MRFILIIMLTIPLSTIAEEGWFKNRKVTEHNIWQKHDSAFIAQLFLSDDPETIYNH